MHILNTYFYVSTTWFAHIHYKIYKGNRVIRLTRISIFYSIFVKLFMINSSSNTYSNAIRLIFIFMKFFNKIVVESFRCTNITFWSFKYMFFFWFCGLLQEFTYKTKSMELPNNLAESLTCWDSTAQIARREELFYLQCL